MGREQKLGQFFWSYGISAIRKLLKLCFDCVRSHGCCWLVGWEETREAVSHGSKTEVTGNPNLFSSYSATEQNRQRVKSSQVSQSVSQSVSQREREKERERKKELLL